MLRILLTWLPRKIRAMIATIAMRARISAYSARPWPSSSRSKRGEELEIQVVDERHAAASWMSTHPQIEGCANIASGPRGMHTGLMVRVVPLPRPIGRAQPPVAASMAFADERRGRRRAVPPKTPRMSAVNTLVRARISPYSTRPWPLATVGPTPSRLGGGGTGRRRRRRRGGARRPRPTARRACRASRPGSGSRARSMAAGRRSPRACAASTASRASARRSSIIAARAGGRSSSAAASGVASGRTSAAARDAETARLDLVGPVEPDDDPLGARAEVGGQRLVDDPEQAALEVHRQPPVRAQRVEVDRDARRAGRARAPRGAGSGTSPRSSRTIGRTSKMNDLVASSVCWTIATSWRTSSPALAGSVADEPLDDLRLEDDVGQALGRSVVHRPGDLAAEVLLRAEEQARDGRRHAARVGDALRPGRPTRRCATGSSPNACERLDVARQRIAVAARAPGACPRGRRPAIPSGRPAW